MITENIYTMSNKELAETIKETKHYQYTQCGGPQCAMMIATLRHY